MPDETHGGGDEPKHEQQPEVVQKCLPGVLEAGSDGRSRDDGTAPLEVGSAIGVGDTIAIDPHSKVVASDQVFLGGNNGRAHAFVGVDAFRPKPNKQDVPDIVRQIRRQRDLPAGDPFADAVRPTTPYQKAAAAEFARLNLDERTALWLSEETARSLRAVPLFMSEDTAFVAMDSVDGGRVMALMVELSRPVSPHLVERKVLDDLLDKVFF